MTEILPIGFIKMINMDGVRGIKSVNYFHTEKWDNKLRFERHETKDDGEQIDAKNRQQTSYQEIMDQLFATLSPDSGTGPEFNVNI